MDHDHNVTPGWYILTPGGWAGPYRDRQRAIDCRIPGVSWPVTYRGGKPDDDDGDTWTDGD